MLEIIIAQFSEIILLPHVLTETSNLVRQIANPARKHVQASLRKLISSCIDIPIPSMAAAEREEFVRLGLTDAAILQFCALAEGDLDATLLTADGGLAHVAHSLGNSLIDYRRDFMSVAH